jgi:hypothetical protein
LQAGKFDRKNRLQINALWFCYRTDKAPTVKVGR